MIINLNHCVFNKNKLFKFDYQFQTDGVSICLFFHKSIPKVEDNNNINQNNNKYQYVHTLSVNQKQDILTNKNIISMDPGIRNCVYLID